MIEKEFREDRILRLKEDAIQLEIKYWERMHQLLDQKEAYENIHLPIQTI